MSLILKLKRINYNNEMKEGMNSIYIISKAIFFSKWNFLNNILDFLNKYFKSV